MRAWFSVPIVKGIRTGISVNMNPAARTYPRASATGAKVWRIGSAIMLVGLAIWLFASMENGRLSEVWWLVTGLVLAARYIFKLVVVAIFPPQTTPGQP